MAIWLVVLMAMLVLATACIVVFKIAPMFWSGAGGANLLGEKLIEDADIARRFADEMLEEASEIWAQESGWHVALKTDVLQVDSIRVDLGPFANSGVYLTRATAKIANSSSEHVFSLMTSVDGFAILDPLSDPADFAIVNEHYSGWRGEGTRLEIQPARAPLPGAIREFCVLDAIDPEVQIFCSKSVQHKSMPGSSKYADGGAPSSGHVRALNTFALRTRSDGSDTMLDLINMADGEYGSPNLMNWINVKGFIPPIIQRLKKRLAKDSEELRLPASGEQDPSKPLLK